MQKIKLTVAFVKNLSVGKDAKYSDVVTPGLQVRVSARSITYYFRKRHNYKIYEFALGHHPDISLEEARTMALNKLAALANYSDIQSPIAHRQPTVGEAVNLWLTYQSNQIKAQSAVKCFAHLFDKKISELRSRDIESVFYSMSSTPYAANNAVRYLKTAIVKTYKKLRAQNPVPFLFDGIKKYPTTPRTRFLLETEAPFIIKKLEEYTQKPLYTDQAKAILLMLYTGQRKSRVLGMTVEQIEQDIKVWHVPGNNIKRPVEHSFNDDAWEIVKKQIALRKKGNLFLWRGRPIKDCRKTLSTICEECNLSNLHLHDLRRSLGSWMLSAGEPIEAVSQTLGHSSTQVTEQVYAHLLATRKREATGRAVRAMREGKV